VDAKNRDKSFKILKGCNDEGYKGLKTEEIHKMTVLDRYFFFV